MSRLLRAVVVLLAPALLGLTACGGAPDGDVATDEEPAAGRTAAETSGEGVGADSTPDSSTPQDEARAPGESADHTHGPATHTHAGTTADTLTAGAALRSPGGGVSPGSVTVLALGDSARIVVEVRGVEAGTRYRAALAGGDCSEPGEPLASLTPVMTGRSGSGSSQTTIAGTATDGHSHGAVRLSETSGSGASGTTACAPVHLTASHDHQDG